MPHFFKKWKMSVILVNIVILIAVISLKIAVDEELLPRIKVGFYCNDQNIMYPYRGDTVPGLTVVLMSNFIPVTLILVFETIIYFIEYEAFERKEFLSFIKKAFIWSKEHVLMMVFNEFLILVCKSAFGEPRPDFLDTCKPDVCEHLNSANTQFKFNFEYECTNKALSESTINNASKSWPSGHASASVYASFFAFWYIQKRVYSYSPRLIGLTLQIICLGLGIFCSMSRILDNRHHWWDVLCGCIIGVLMAIFTVKMFCNNFSTRALNSSQIILTNKRRNENNLEDIEIK